MSASSSYPEIEFHMAFSAKANQIAEIVGHMRIFRRKIGVGRNVCYVRTSPYFLFSLTAKLASMVITFKCRCALSLPVRPSVIAMASAFPMRAINVSKMIRKPRQPAFVVTESFSYCAWMSKEILAAHFASSAHSLYQALHRAAHSLTPRGNRHREILTASYTYFNYLIRVTYTGTILSASSNL